jgi:glutathione S-transferase
MTRRSSAASAGRRCPTSFNLTPGRRKVKKLTGETTVPVLVTGEGEVVAGSREIVAWAERSAARPNRRPESTL